MSRREPSVLLDDIRVSFLADEKTLLTSCGEIWLINTTTPVAYEIKQDLLSVYPVEAE